MRQIWVEAAAAPAPHKCAAPQPDGRQLSAPMKRSTAAPFCCRYGVWMNRGMGERAPP